MNTTVTKHTTRRRILRGMLNGAAVSMGLPILDCLLNTNGTAFANGELLPIRFGTWFWGLGLSRGHWQPDEVGPDYKLKPQLQPLEPFKDRLNIFSGGQAYLDGKSNQTHFSGAQAIMTGTVSPTNAGYSRSFDTIIADVIGTRTRFRSLEVACDGDPRSSWSARTTGGINPAEASPVALYTRIFGPEFVDPNAAAFTPDPAVMIRKSALSAVKEERRRLMSRVGVSDRTKLEEFFESVRSLENKLKLQLERPEPLPACSMPDELTGTEFKSTVLGHAISTHALFAKLLTHALACGQTRVFNITLSQGMSGLRLEEGDVTNHHGYTHEEPIDAILGYQPICAKFVDQYMKALYELIVDLDGIREGDGTLLDQTVVYAFTDHEEARLHSLQNYPFFTIGSAGGRMKTGLHVSAPGEAVTRVGLTMQQLFGVPVSSWGTGSNKVTAPYYEVMI